MGTSTVTQAREPQKVGEPYNLNRTQKKNQKPRNCVKTQMMQRDCGKKQYFSFFIILWELKKSFGQRQISVPTAGVPPDREGEVRGRKMGREVLRLHGAVASRWEASGRTWSMIHIGGSSPPGAHASDHRSVALTAGLLMHLL